MRTFLLIAVAGCMTEPATAEDSQDLACLTANTRIDHSLVTQDPTVLARFGFARTMQQIRNSMPGATGTALTLFQNWMATYGDCTNPLIDPYHWGEQCPRGEAQIAALNPLDPASPLQFKPIAIFNRFDLAPTDGSNCGEYRIVYEMNVNSLVIGNLFFNFEGALPNPDRAAGIEGCRAIAQWWQDRSSDASATVLATNLEKFFYVGSAIPGVGPVVDARNYGLGMGHHWYTSGQIRANSSANNFGAWNVREFKTSLQNPTTANPLWITIDHVADSNKPANELVNGTSSLYSDFKAGFLPQVRPLAALNLASVNMNAAGWTNEYESTMVDGSNATQYDQIATDDLRGAIQTQLTRLGITDLTPNQILLRAQSQTCTGCHLESSNRDMGRGQIWPASLIFVHVKEGQLSPALVNVFLPYRRQVLQSFLCNAASITSNGLTLGGSQPGADN